MDHEEQLTLFDGARNKLREYGIKPNISELKQVTDDLENLENREKELERKRDAIRTEIKELEQKYENITRYLGIKKDKDKDIGIDMGMGMDKKMNKDNAKDQDKNTTVHEGKKDRLKAKNKDKDINKRIR